MMNRIKDISNKVLISGIENVLYYLRYKLTNQNRDVGQDIIKKIKRVRQLNDFLDLFIKNKSGVNIKIPIFVDILNKEYNLDYENINKKETYIEILEIVLRDMKIESIINEN